MHAQLHPDSSHYLHLGAAHRVKTSYLHPEEESLGTSFKLQHKDPSRRALAHPFELAVVGEDDQVLKRDIRKAS